ncbi:flagellar hook-length control protein FliK [Wenzhouxiangella sp. XN24]|uniref:flagellar hook-length control protein FliK n=1 Tax=Wenzhouxiangella sp. XN24 TaxID=2713569 RepID=UPI0013EC72D0|nr:flagellar hook-length control protein FliK [Wenzhouxiangella sp. XN24]NGX16234.1 hypothetical protein [Wenzhouxiangella sp. XN24]
MMSNMPAALAESGGPRLPGTRGDSAESGRSGKDNEFASVLADSESRARSAEKPAGGEASNSAAREDADAGKDSAAGKESSVAAQDEAGKTSDKPGATQPDSGAEQEKAASGGAGATAQDQAAGTQDGDGPTEDAPGGEQDDPLGVLAGQPDPATGDAGSGNVLPLTGELLPPGAVNPPPGFAFRAPGSGPMPGVPDPLAAATLLNGELPAGGLPAGTDGPESLTRMLEMLRTLNGMPGQFREQLQAAMLRKPGAAGLELVEAPRSGTLAGNSSLQAAVSASPLANLAAQAGTPPTTPPSLPINIAPGRPDWGEAVGQRVLWMVSNKAQEAELRLNPSELGRVDVKVRVDEDGLRLTFAAGNSAVREALEAAAPRLREMFQAEGLHLENMDIGQQQAGAGERGDASADAEAGRGVGEADDETLPGAQAVARAGLGLVDLFV